MRILRNKLFSGKEKEDNIKLKPFDRLKVWEYKHEGSRKRATRAYKGDGKYQTNKETALTGAISGGPLMIFHGTTPLIELGEGKYKSAAKKSITGAITMPLINEGTAYLKREAVKKNPHVYDKQFDLMDVATGKMSKEDFTKKWYKEKSKDVNKKD